MILYQGKGGTISLPAGSEMTAESRNLFHQTGGVLLKGYTVNNHKLVKDENSQVVYGKLAAGGNYLFGFDSQVIIHIVKELPDAETWKNTGLTEWVYYGWVQNFWTEQKEARGSYIYTPEQDVYVLAGLSGENGFYVWDGEWTGDIDPGGALGGGSFRIWNQGDDGYSAYPFKAFLEETVVGEPSEVFRKEVARASDVNRIYSGNLPVIWVGDSIMYAASNVGVPDSYRYQTARALDLPWNYHAVSGTTITDGYGMAWDGSEETGMKGYSGFVATETGGQKAETPEELYRQAKLVVLAMGTNDFGNSAPLGTPEDGGTDAFYGAFRAWLRYFQSWKTDLPVIVITPFKREDWAVPNAQNLILPDYIRAMYEVAREFRHVYLLDVFDKWYADTDNAAIRARNSIDGLHPSAWFHDCFSMDLVERIKAVCRMEGLTG